MNNANITKNDSKTQTTPLKQIHVSAAVIFRTAAGGGPFYAFKLFFGKPCRVLVLKQSKLPGNN